ncbi:bile acid-CoA:amino acid N-acyltransferase-like [Protopterus annectens]|uniref:bile acid-CoA:amino acid N-acyltransferase-like n=1 Tax=Protopterus annectens TaxID=7888 RepID=UPI001CFA10C8|nr:bile acid-CoA:amino acid N-acyltransferase-like [Protopterus annectens]XP_043943813.1 bile acid-CoA:amino acid N-acyltransferase-like [Protopterus annectens]
MKRLLSTLQKWHMLHFQGPCNAVTQRQMPLLVNKILQRSKATALQDAQSIRSRYQTDPVIIARPTKAVVDEQIDICVENLLPNQAVTLHSLQKTEYGHLWESFAHYVSSTDGTVQVMKDESLGGSYTGCEPMGFIWSMTPDPEDTKKRRLMKTDASIPDIVKVSVVDGHILERAAVKLILADTEVERWHMAPGVRKVKVRQNGIVGNLFLPPGPGPFPGIIDLLGATGAADLRAGPLASHGFATLQLAYISHAELPYPTGYFGLTNDYFEEAYNFLNSHPEVAKDRIGIVGLCFGQYFTIKMATEIPKINPRCLVGVSGGHFSMMKNETGFAHHCLIEYNAKKPFDTNIPVSTKHFLLPILDKPDRILQVGKIRCPLLLIAGEDDQSFPAVEAAADIERKMKEAGNNHLLTKISYPGAGHIIEPPFFPLNKSSKIQIPTMKTKFYQLWGGEPKAHAYAQEDSWKRILEFLKQHLAVN